MNALLPLGLIGGTIVSGIQQKFSQSYNRPVVAKKTVYVPPNMSKQSMSGGDYVKPGWRMVDFNYKMSKKYRDGYVAPKAAALSSGGPRNIGRPINYGPRPPGSGIYSQSGMQSHSSGRVRSDIKYKKRSVYD